MLRALPLYSSAGVSRALIYTSAGRRGKASSLSARPVHVRLLQLKHLCSDQEKMAGFEEEPKAKRVTLTIDEMLRVCAAALLTVVVLLR